MHDLFRRDPRGRRLDRLPAFAPDGGIRAVGAVAGITHQIGRSFGVYGLCRL